MFVKDLNLPLQEVYNRTNIDVTLLSRIENGRRLPTKEQMQLLVRFYGCESFNQDLSNWNTENLWNASDMFRGCKSFNQDLSNWNTENLETASCMFNGCESFNQDLSNWNTENLRDVSV